MITMGGTRSHKIPFIELGKGLHSRGHNITFINAFPPSKPIDGILEITPPGLVFYVRNYTNWDLLGSRLRGEEPLSPYDIFRYGFQVCDHFLNDFETKQMLNSRNRYDLMILDGAFPECALGMAHHLKVPYMYINTVGLYMGSISSSGSPVPWSMTPFFGRSFSDDMTLYERFKNTGFLMLLTAMHYLSTKIFVQHVVRSHLGASVPDLYELSSNVSFVVQIGHHSVTYPRPYLPNILEAGCIHCKPPKPLPKDLEDFINLGGDRGFILMSMGSSVRTFNFPEYLRLLFVKVFAQLPYQVLWKWEEEDMPDLPNNVKLGRWLPQQDLLGHPKIRAFVTHGGLLSMLETVFHAVPIVTMPVFCDHDADAKKAEIDGYALKLELAELTPEKLLRALKTVIQDPKYKENAKQRSVYLRDVPISPLRSAIYWTEYVLRHKGAQHLKSPSRNLGVIQYYLIDVVFIYFVIFVTTLFLFFTAFKILLRLLCTNHFKNVLTVQMKLKIKQH